MQPRTRISSPRAALIAAALAAFVFAQMLGLMHRIVHSHLAATSESGAAWSQATTSFADGGADGLHKLFSGHHHDGDCESYDKLSHGDALNGVQQAVLPTWAPITLVCTHERWNLAAQSAGFLARAPPDLS